MSDYPHNSLLFMVAPSQAEKPNVAETIRVEQDEAPASSTPRHPILEPIASFLVSDSPSAAKIRRGILKTLVLGGAALLREETSEPKKASHGRARHANSSRKRATSANRKKARTRQK